MSYISLEAYNDRDDLGPKKGGFNSRLILLSNDPNSEI